MKRFISLILVFSIACACLLLISGCEETVNSETTSSKLTFIDDHGSKTVMSVKEIENLKQTNGREYELLKENCTVSGSGKVTRIVDVREASYDSSHNPTSWQIEFTVNNEFNVSVYSKVEHLVYVGDTVRFSNGDWEGYVFINDDASLSITPAS